MACSLHKRLRSVNFAVDEKQMINPGEIIEPMDVSEDVEELRAATPFDSIPTDTYYTIAVTIGNRWGADTTTDLYIFIHGRDGISKRIDLTHEVSNVGLGITLSAVLSLCLFYGCSPDPCQ